MAKDKYYQSPRRDLLALIPHDVKRVLDIGCGEGEFGRIFKEERGGVVVGVENNKSAVEGCKEKLDRVIEGDIESVNIPFPRGYFEAIVWGDILEHLRDPWHQLKRFSEYLSKGGYAIMSIPNIAYYSVIFNLCLKRWRYQERGIMDITHLRFFTLEGIRDLVQDAGLEIIRIEKRYRFTEKGSKADRFARIMSFIPFVGEYFVNKYLVVARK